MGDLTPTDGQSTPPNARARGRTWGPYFAGIGIGFIPVVCFMLGIAPFYFTGVTSFSALANIGLCLYGLVVLVMLITIFGKETRPLGQGLLTMVLIGPIIAAIGCSVFSRPV